MDYKRKQKELRKRSKSGRFFKSGNKPHVIDRDGLFGSELEVLDAMFTKDKKSSIKIRAIDKPAKEGAS